MNDNMQYILYPMLRFVMKKEQPKSILEISNARNQYGKILQNKIQKEYIHGTRIDRIILGNIEPESVADIYDSILPNKLLFTADELNTYDFIFIVDLFEYMSIENGLILLEHLQRKITRQIFIATLEEEQELDEKKMNKVAYLQPFIYKYDYCYKTVVIKNKNIHVYSIFPKVEYSKIGLDQLRPAICNRSKLNIAYIIPIKELTGGLKSNLEQIRMLHERGHNIKLYMKGDTDRIIPEWSTLSDHDVDEQIVVPEDELYLDYICKSDVIVLAGAMPIDEFKNSSIPIVLWEQGYGYLLGNYDELIDSRDGIHREMCNIYRSNIHIFSVSELVKTILKERYNRRTCIVPTFIDTQFYYPVKKVRDIPTVMLVGNPLITFKNFEYALKILRIVKNRGYTFQIVWACQELPLYDVSDLEIEFYVMVSQEKLSQLYREADIVLSTSIMESFPLPPLEAMASGTAVLTTDSIGIHTYGISGENCIICEQGDIDAMIESLIILLEDEEYRNRLSITGRKTSLDFSIEHSTELMEKELYHVVANGVSC